VRRDLRGLSKEGADWVAAHLVAAGALADEEPEQAWHHARAARARGGRIGVVRETVGLVAYRAGEWAEAIGELRAARRMGGGPGHLAVMADCERALGHPERAIELSRSAEADALDPEAVLELSIVVAGARADLDQIDAALAHLERIGLETAEQHPRLAYAYADLLLKAGRQAEAVSWFIRSANADAEEETDALERVEFLSAEMPSVVDELTGASDNAAPAAVADTGTPAELDLDDDLELERPAPASPAAPATASGSDRDTTDDPDSGATGAVETEASETKALETESVDVQPAAVPVEPEPVFAAAGPENTSEADVEPDEDSAAGVPTLLFSDDPQTGDR
jgi:tetratricopeptide (TPR) repeat protein